VGEGWRVFKRSSCSWGRIFPFLGTRALLQGPPPTWDRNDLVWSSGASGYSESYVGCRPWLGDSWYLFFALLNVMAVKFWPRCMW